MAKSEWRPGEGGRGDRSRRPHLTAGGGWTVERHELPPAALHTLGMGDPPGRTVRLCRPAEAAIVVGSTQALPPPGPLPVVRRRGGGGAVVVVPGELVWIDVVIPRADPLWDDDVGRAFFWLGEVWWAALTALGVEGAEVHEGGVVCTPWCRAVCFSGLGPGETTVGERKAVGMSQRRTREAALFQSALLRRWDPSAYVHALDLPPAAGPALQDAVVAFPDLDIATVESTFLRHLPT